MAAFFALHIHGGLEKIFQELQQWTVRIHRRPGATRQTLVVAKGVLFVDVVGPTNHMDMDGASALILESVRVVVDLLDAMGSDALQHYIVEQFCNGVIHVHGEHRLGHTEGIVVLEPLEEAMMPWKMPFRWRDGEEQVWEPPLSTHVLQFLLLLDPEGSEILHAIGGLVGGDALVLRNSDYSADLPGQCNIVEQAEERKVLLVAPAATREFSEPRAFSSWVWNSLL